MPPNTTQVIDSEEKFLSLAPRRPSLTGSLSHQQGTGGESRGRLRSGCPARVAPAPLYICPRGTRFEVQR